MAMIVIYWYSILSVAIVVTAALVSVYVLCRNETQNGGAPAHHEVKQSLYQSLLQTAVLVNPNNNDLHQLVQSDSITSASTDSTSGCWPRSQQLWTSCWRGLHPGVLLVLRIVSFFVLAFFLSWDIHKWGASIFICYYTEWAYSLVMLYFAIGIVVSAHGCWLYYTHRNTCIESVEGSQGRDDLEGNPETVTRVTEKEDISSLPIKLQRQYYQEQDAQRAGFWGYLMQISYQISAGAVILTDIIFWCFIVPFVSNAHLGLNLLMACIHTVNFAFLLLETSINHLPFPFFRLAYFVLWSSAYVMFQWLIHLCGYTWWPYPFLKLSTPMTPLWYLLMALFHIVCYGLYALIVKAKDLVFTKLFPHSYMRSY